MLKNYLTIAWRSLKRDKLFAFLNIFGLAIGITACLLIYIYVQDELSYDAHHAKGDRIYRVQAHFKFGDQLDHFGIVPFPTVRTLLDEFPEIDGGTQLFQIGTTTLIHEGRPFVNEVGYYADTSYFRTFDHKWIAGGPEALDGPDNVVITKEMATRMFGSEDPMGKMVTRNDRTLRIAGVIDGDAYNTHTELGVFLSLLGMPPQAQESLGKNWGNVNSYSYLVLHPDATAESFQPKMDELVAKHVLPQWQGFGFNGEITFNVEPLREVHFNNELIYDTPKKGNKAYVTLLAVVAVLILVIACINFINMSTADATRRAKEVALRKVSGAQRGQLVAQFIGGSTMVAVISIVIALVLLYLALPIFNELSGKEIGLGYVTRGGFLLVLLVIVLAIGVIAGSYPALFLSRFSPQLLLKEGIGAGAGKQRVRKMLMGVQFVITLFMVVGTLAVYSQLHWMRNADMGYRKEQLMWVQMPTPPPNDTLQWAALKTIKTEMLRESFVKGAAFASAAPGQGGGRLVLQVKTDDGFIDRPMPLMNGDTDFPDVLGLQLVAGRYFDPAIPSDENSAVIVNESLVKAYGWRDPLSQSLYAPDDPNDEEPQQELKVIGVVKDFHYTSLHTPIEPIVIYQSDPRYANGILMLRLEPGNVGQQLATLQERWNELLPGREWNASFLDESLAELYQTEDTLFRVFTGFAILTILLTAMGLYGLAYFTARQRTKEIGIRRVLGASLADIIGNLNKEFILLIGAAVIIAFPLAFYAVQRWLEGFAYHTSVSPLLFVAALLVTLIITLATVSWHAYRSAVSDPVKALRYE